MPDVFQNAFFTVLKQRLVTLARMRQRLKPITARTTAAVLAMGLTAAMPAWAARPFVTDDARLTTAGSCQLESWTRLYRQSTELWALPACNPTGNLELTVGGGHARTDGTGSSDDYVLQLKTLARPLRTNDWGIGLAVGTIRHPQINPGPNLLGNTYAYLPFSASFADDRLVIHANLGWLRDKATQRNQLTWGLGSEINLSPHWTLVAESFGTNAGASYWQAGARYHLVPGLWQLDSTIGRQSGGPTATQWLSFGLRFTPASLF